MESIQLPVLRCRANCTRCGLPTEFPIFESGPGGDFATYLGEKTGSLYCVSLGKINYAGKSIESLLAPAIEREGSRDALRQLPEDVKCKICGNVFSAQSMPIDREDVASAYVL
jgi:hypothetical protein